MENKRQQPMKQIKNHNQGVVRCRKHPKHHQSPGVCSVCLREKLSQLASSSACSSTSSRSMATMAASSSCPSSSSSLSSLSSSSCDSPVYYHHHHHRSRLDGRGYNNINMSGVLKSSRKSAVLVKSRSMATFMPRLGERERGQEREDSGVKRKSGFWSKLLMRSKSKKTDLHQQGLMHSRTMVERLPTTAIASTRVH